MERAVRCYSGTEHTVSATRLARGVYLAPSAFEAGFMSSAHGDAEIAATVAAAREAFVEARA